jgi:hypothetical protein
LPEKKALLSIFVLIKELRELFVHFAPEEKPV